MSDPRNPGKSILAPGLIEAIEAAMDTANADEPAHDPVFTDEPSSPEPE